VHRRPLFAIAAILLAVAAISPLVISRPADASPSMEQAFINEINALRGSQGLPALAVHSNLTSKARSWAQTMAGAGRIYHSDLQSGITANWKRLGENVGVGSDVTSLHNAFVASPTHYKNLVDSTFTHVGVGVYVGPDGTVWVAEEFMQLMETAPPTTRAPITTQAPPPPPAPVTLPPTTQPQRPVTIPAPTPTSPQVTSPPQTAPVQLPSRTPSTTNNQVVVPAKNSGGASQTPTTQAPAAASSSGGGAASRSTTTTAAANARSSTTSTTAARNARSTTTTTDPKGTGSATNSASANDSNSTSDFFEVLRQATDELVDAQPAPNSDRSAPDNADTPQAGTSTTETSSPDAGAGTPPAGSETANGSTKADANGSASAPGPAQSDASLWDATEVAGPVNFSATAPSDLSWDDLNADWRWDLVAEVTQ